MAEQTLATQGIALLNRARVFANGKGTDVVRIEIEGEGQSGFNVAGQVAGHEVEEKSDVVEPAFLLDEVHHLRPGRGEPMANRQRQWANFFAATGGFDDCLAPGGQAVFHGQWGGRGGVDRQFAVEGRPVAGGALEVVAQEAINARQNGCQLLGMHGQNPQAVLGKRVERLVVGEDPFDDGAFFAGANQVADIVIIVAIIVAQQGLYGEAFFRGRSDAEVMQQAKGFNGGRQCVLGVDDQAGQGAVNLGQVQ